MDYQRSQAQDKVGLMKVGIEPLITAEQNPVIYAETYILAAAQAQESLQQGGNPAEVATFVDLAGQSAMQHLKRFENDPMRKAQYDELNQRLDVIAANNDQLLKQIQQQREQQGAQQQATQQFMTDEEMKQRKNEADISRKERKLQIDLAAKSAKSRQSLAINDVSTAQQLQINRLKATQSNGNGKHE
jgi:hypothetical protein